MGLLHSKSGPLWVCYVACLAYCGFSHWIWPTDICYGFSHNEFGLLFDVTVTDSATMNLAHHLMLSIMGSSTVNWAPYSKLGSLWVRHQEWISAWVRSVSYEIQHQSYSVESNMGHRSSTPLLPGLPVIPFRSPWRGCCGPNFFSPFIGLGWIFNQKQNELEPKFWGWNAEWGRVGNPEKCF